MVFRLLDSGLRDDLLFMNYAQALCQVLDLNIFLLQRWNIHSFEPSVLV